MNYLKYLVEEIHTTVMASVDNNGLPVTCAIDMMDYDESGLYFLTAKGKNLYERLKQKGYVALTGMKGSDTLSCASVSVSGKAQEIGSEPLDSLFEKNRYMKEIYPTEQSRKALTVFRIYEGNVEWFDLSKKPIERASFTFGNGQKTNHGYEIGNNCVGCKACETVCPQNCIDFGTVPAKIIQNNCLHCGNCMTVCLNNAIIKRG